MQRRYGGRQRRYGTVEGEDKELDRENELGQKQAEISVGVM